MNDMRERLIELLNKAKHEFWCSREKGNGTEFVAEYLIANGVIVLPCKVGDTVYTIHRSNYAHNWKPYVDELRVEEINHKCDRSGKDIGWGLVLYSIENYTTTRYKVSNVGKIVFLTREEAERALKERE